MKITKKQLQKIIQEEIYQILKEHETEEEHMHSQPVPVGPQRGAVGGIIHNPAPVGTQRGRFGPLPAPNPLTDPEGLQPGIGPTGHSKAWMLRQPGGEDLYADYLATIARSHDVELNPEEYPGEPEPGTFGPPVGPQNIDIRESYIDNIVEAVLTKLIK